MVERRRIVLVGEDPLALEGLMHLLARELDPHQLETAVASEARALDEFDVCIWDFGTAESAHVELPTETAVIALVTEGAMARRAFAAGARGVLLRDVSAQRLARAVDAVSDGLVVVDEELAEDAMRPPPTGLAATETLTPRELEVLHHLALGLSNKDIAERLGVSPHTAKFHVNSLMGKLGATSRTEVVAMAARAGLVTF